MTGFESPDPFAFFGDYDRIKETDFSYFPTSSLYTYFSQYPTSPNYSQQFYPTYPKSFPLADFESFAAQGRTHTEREAPKRPLVNLGESIVEQTDFSLSLAKHVISTTEAKHTNFVFSPLSMHVVLSMVAAGSSGPTRDQLLGYLKSKSVEELNSLSSEVSTLLFADGGPLGGPCLSFANGIWVDKSLTTFKPAFKEIVDKDYKATSSDQVDFLNKAIKGLLGPDSVDSNTRLILANTLYFKGSWENKLFDTFLTKDNDFFLLNGTSVRVPFMSSLKKQFVRAFKGFKVLRLPYEQGDDTRRFSMYIYLPDDNDGLSALVKKIGGFLVPGFIQNQLPSVPSLVNKLIQNQNQMALSLQALVNKFGSDPRFIQNHLPERLVLVRDFRVPKFKINYDFEASGVLQGHGLTLPFSPGGLTEMVENGEGLKVSEFFQKTCIEVDEKGSEAAACVNDWQETLGSLPSHEPEVDFVADHPFLFVVREDVSGGVLFVGQVVDPIAG